MKNGMAAALCGVLILVLAGAAQAGIWDTTNLSQGRQNLAGASAGGVVFFAGGSIGGTMSNVVDIYDTTSHTWSVSHLSQARENLTAISCGNQVFFAAETT